MFSAVLDGPAYMLSWGEGRGIVCIMMFGICHEFQRRTATDI